MMSASHDPTITSMKNPQQIKENTSRLYLALWPDKITQNKLHSMCHTWAWPHGASVAKPESLHLTLHFLGDVPDHRIPELIQGLKVPVRPFDLMLCRHQLSSSGIAVLKPNAIPAELKILHDWLDETLRKLEISTPKRTYRPHVTLARNAANAIPPTLKQVQPVIWTVTGYALVKSHHGYKILHNYD
jgi:RNA 2',3'-cyclic 3'-phosphodiesterase